MTSEYELKPCPYCGHDRPYITRFPQTGVWLIHCPKCDALFSKCQSAQNTGRTATINLWNKRVKETAHLLNGGDGLYDTCSNCKEEIYLASPMKCCPNCGCQFVSALKNSEN